MDSFPLTDITAVGAVFGLVVLFLKFLKEERDSRDERRAEEREAQNSVLREIGGQCHEFQRDMLTRHEKLGQRLEGALDRNTEQMGKNAEALDHCANVMSKFDSDLVKQMKDLTLINERKERQSS